MSINPNPLNLQGLKFVGLFGVVLVASCSGVPTESSAVKSSSPAVSDIAAEGGTPAIESDRSISIPAPSTQLTPKLIKTAVLQLELTDIDGAIAAISDLLTQSQGDLLQLSDQEPQGLEVRHVSLQLRVPEGNLEPTLEALRALGKVETQSITAEDVSGQLVDLQARIRNLRKSEEALLAIMERTGSIAEVLEVSQELSAVREAIERSDAQLQSLQNRVAYSTITVTLVSTQQPIPATAPMGETLGQTWQTATFAVRNLSVGLLQLTLWLLVFSPYIGLLVIGGWTGRRYWRSHHRPGEPANPN